MDKNEVKILRIAIFDDNLNVRESIALLLATTKNMQLVGAFSTYKHLLEEIEFIKPDVVLMDIDMPYINGIEAVRILRKKYVDLPILMLTGFEDDDKVFDSLCAGANGYILKNARLEQLIAYILDVYEGGVPMTPIIARKVLDQFKSLQPSKTEQIDYDLSNREKDVLGLLVKGKSYKMIAGDLAISYETVHTHIRKIYQKLQVNSVGEAVSKTINRNILRMFFI